MNYQDIIVYDFETTGKNPHRCQPIQLGAVAIHGRKLEIHEESGFKSFIQPIWDEKECERLGLDPFNEEVTDVTGITKEDLEGAPSMKVVWTQFQQYVAKYNYRQGRWGAPIKAGQNIHRYDNIIIDRITGGHLRNARNQLDILSEGGIIKEEAAKEVHKLEPYGFGPWENDRQEEGLFFPAGDLDLRDVLWFWFENVPEVKSLSMDAMREYFGMETKGSHQADKDAEDVAKLLIKFLKLHRHYGPKIKFKGAFK
jgi:DNA polymerase III epsilon subunit-like protein